MGVRDAASTIGRSISADGWIWQYQGCGKVFCASCANAEPAAEETHRPDRTDRYPLVPR